MSILLDETATCIECGYCLHGLAEARCPECGCWFDPEDQRTFVRMSDSVRLLELRWLMAAVVPTGICIAAMILFATLLALNGLRVHDLWNGTNPSSGVQASPAAKFVKPGQALANYCQALSALTFLYCAGLVVFAKVRDDPRAFAVAAMCMVICVISGSLAIGLASTIAGI
jgi:hypothetical protein